MGIHLLNIKRAVAAIVLVCSMGVAYAADFVVDGISYKILSADDKTCAVTASETGYTGDIVVPATVTNGDNEYAVTTIDNTAFKGNKNITSVAISNGVTTLEKSTFTGCSNMTLITIPGSVAIIPNGKCMSCSNLVMVNILDGVESIVDAAFWNCDLTELVLPKSLKTVGANAFKGCELTNIKVYAETPPEIKASSFDDDVYNNAVLEVPSSAMSKYKMDTVWGRFSNRAELEQEDETPTSIETVKTENGVAVEYYNILGVKVENPTKGLYIKRCGNKAYKVML